MSVLPLAFEKIWFEKTRYDEAESIYIQTQYNQGQPKQESLASQIEKARENIQSTLAGKPTGCCKGKVACMDKSTTNLNPSEILENLEKKHEFLTISLEAMKEALADILTEINSLRSEMPKGKVETAKPEPVAAKEKCTTESDSDDVELFGEADDEEEDAEYLRLKEERVKAYHEKKSKKPGPIAKSSVLLDVKPWDDQTDMAQMEIMIKTIEMDGLRWGASQLVPLAFGIKKLSILCIVEDDKVSVDDVSEKIEKFEDFVQSVDIAAFNKV